MTKLVFKVRSEGRYAASRFPLRLRPLEDELLSSWLIRLALLHRTMPMTFTNLYLPETKNRFWSADIDLQADQSLLMALSSKSGLPVELLRSMTLKAYEGYLFEEVYGKTGGTPFINPLGLRGRRSTLPGLRYCQECLRTDESPYFRKKWRLALSVACPEHHRYLHGHCPNCGSPLTPYLACKVGGLDVCFECGCKLSKAKTRAATRNVVDTEGIRKLFVLIDAGYLMRDGTPVYSHLYFQVLHQTLKLMMNRRYGPKIREAVGLKSTDVTGGKTFESMSIQNQSDILSKAVWLLDEWPERFVGICKRQGVLSSVLLRDMRQAPFWYWRVVMESLYRPDHYVMDEEIREALRFMERRGMAYSEQALSRLLGVGQVFRKRSSKLINLSNRNYLLDK